MDEDKRVKRATLQGSSKLEGTLQCSKPAATWADLTCSKDTLTKLRNICRDFTPNKSFYCLFAGESHTDKIMAAEIIAYQLHSDLCRIDLSAIVGKYTHETEENLDRIFSLSQANNAILFFDEADALFGERSKAKDGHDRYAIIEINYMLQRMQKYPGLTILSIIKENAVDDSFLRHFRYIIDFSDLE